MSHSSAPQSLNSPFMLASPISAGSGPASMGGGVVVTSTGSPMATAGMIPAESFSAPNTGMVGIGVGESPVGIGLVRRDSDPGIRGSGQGQDDEQVGLGLGIPTALLVGKTGVSCDVSARSFCNGHWKDVLIGWFGTVLEGPTVSVDLESKR